MKYEVYPLAMTQIDWRIFQKICQDNLGFSPTRGLDQANINLKSPAAPLGAINMENDPARSYREGFFTGQAWLHISFSFIVIVEPKVLFDLVRSTHSIHIISKQKDEESIVAILTGRIVDWQNAVLAGCSDFSFRLRRLMNQIHTLFHQNGLKDLWHEYERFPLKDDTYILRRKHA